MKLINNLEKFNWIDVDDINECYYDNLIYLKKINIIENHSQNDKEEFLDNILFDVMIDIIRDNNQRRNVNIIRDNNQTINKFGEM